MLPLALLYAVTRPGLGKRLGAFLDLWAMAGVQGQAVSGDHAVTQELASGLGQRGGGGGGDPWLVKLGGRGQRDHWQADVGFKGRWDAG